MYPNIVGGPLKHVEIKSPEGKPNKTQLFINGEEFTGAIKELKLTCGVGQVTEIVLQMYPQNIVFDGSAAVSVEINGKKYFLSNPIDTLPCATRDCFGEEILNERLEGK